MDCRTRLLLRSAASGLFYSEEPAWTQAQSTGSSPKLCFRPAEPLMFTWVPAPLWKPVNEPSERIAEQPRMPGWTVKIRIHEAEAALAAFHGAGSSLQVEMIAKDAPLKVFRAFNLAG